MLTYTSKQNKLNVLTTFVMVLAFAVFSSAQNESWKNPSRFMDWSQAGADTSVRASFKKIYDVMKYGFIADGKYDNDTKLRKLLAKAKPYSIIYFPEGTYFFASSIDVPSNIIIRGAGSRKTKFNFKTLKLGQRGVFNMASYERLNPTELTKAAKVGDVTIHVNDVSGYQKGDIIELFMENDSALMYTQARWDVSWASTARGQIIEVEKVNSIDNSITLKQAVRLDYNLKDAPAIHKQAGFHNIGFENFSIENFLDEDLIMFYFREGRNCWVDNIESINVVKHHVLFEASSKCSVLNSFMTKSFRNDGGGHGYGVACSNHTSDCLVENCIFSELRHALMTKKGANGNVFIHNYCFDGTWDRDDSGRPPATVSVHGHYSYLNLFEGNIVERITSADFWGPSGPGTTFINNIVTDDIIEIRDASIDQNIISNITLSGKIKISKESTNTLSSGNTSGLIQEDKLEGQPTSLFYSSKPAYFGELDWPITKNYKQNKIVLPAQNRFITKYK